MGPSWTAASRRAGELARAKREAKREARRAREEERAAAGVQEGAVVHAGAIVRAGAVVQAGAAMQAGAADTGAAERDAATKAATNGAMAGSTSAPPVLPSSSSCRLLLDVYRHPRVCTGRATAQRIRKAQATRQSLRSPPH